MIDIVIATYNPNHYLNEQIDSILGQTRLDLVSRIIITDDSRSPNEVIKQNLEKDGRIEYHANQSDNKGVLSNFSNGLSLTTSELIMTCDQDDVWFENKVEVSFNAIREINDEPALVGTNSMLSDQHGHSLGKTFTQNTSVNFDEIDSVKILFSNFVPGCTMLFNRKLLESVMPFPQEAVMHDWWLMINAFLHGKFAYISEPTMYYRQHSSNVIGARKRSLWNIVFKGDGFSRLKEFNRDFNAVVVQAGCVDYIGGDERVTKAILNAKSYFGMTRISKVNFIKCYSNASLIRKLSLCLLVLFQP